MKVMSLMLMNYLLVVSVLAGACRSEISSLQSKSNSTQNLVEAPQPTETIEINSVESLCSRLAELKHIPSYPGEASEDTIYNGFMKTGKKAIPCLIDKITDSTVIDDPMDAPHVQGFTVGDAAVFLLLYITKMQWKPDEMFPPEYARRWKDDGIYAYFAYTEKAENRKAFQLWWKKWAAKNLKE